MTRKTIIGLVGLGLMAFSSPALAGKVHVITVDDVINPATVNFIETSIGEAETKGAEALIIEINTPGGLVSSTKEIVQLFYAAELPVVVYVSPAGATAASAGMMITIAGHVAVMAPGSNIGAAHPVIFDQEGYKSLPKDDVMMEKLTNDAVAWVKSICDVRGRNLELAEKAVSESKSYTAEEAVEGKLVDGTAKDFDELLASFLHDRVVGLNSGDTVRMETKGAEVIRLKMSVPQLLQDLINNPNFIYVIMLVGLLGVGIEFKAPGLIFPALIGVGLIIFALFAPSIPIRYAGFMIMIIGFAFLIAELFITSYGVLSMAGISAIVFGSLMLFDKPEVPDMHPFLMPEIAPSLYIVVPFAVFIALIIMLFGGAIVRAHAHKVMTGKEEMAGEEAVAETEIGPGGGKIFAHGEIWNAVSETAVAKGEKVVIKSVKNLLCRVEPAGGAKPLSEDSAGQ